MYSKFLAHPSLMKFIMFHGTLILVNYKNWSHVPCSKSLYDLFLKLLGNGTGNYISAVVFCKKAIQAHSQSTWIPLKQKSVSWMLPSVPLIPDFFTTVPDVRIQLYTTSIQPSFPEHPYFFILKAVVLSVQIFSCSDMANSL